MLGMESGERDMEVNPGYAFGQFAKAYETARTHGDQDTRERAVRRMDQWSAVLKGMASGKLTVGSRKPVDDLPAWVTPEVVRGGFATGAAAAEGPMDAFELDLVRRAAIAAKRAALFEYLVSEAGLQELSALLTGQSFDVRVPEEAALLTLVWLVRQQDHAAAVSLAQELSPMAHRLRFVPAPAADCAVPPSVVFREPVRSARETLFRRREHERLATMRETLTVWNPYADELLDLWLQTSDGAQVAAVWPEGWAQRAAALFERYHLLATQHRRASKHRKPKENLNVLLRATEQVAKHQDLDATLRRRLRHAVDCMVAKRGVPGSPEHTALRAGQASVAGQPTHHALAKIAVARLAALPQSRGVTSTARLIEPVTPAEADASGIPASTEMPPSVKRVIARTLESTPERLIAEGVVGSAEVLAELVPRIAAGTVAAAYVDPDLQAVVSANYEAFRRRRSLLLLDLEHQVRVEELPWVRAVARYRTANEDTLDSARAALVRLAELTLTAFPATIVPSPLVSELQVLAHQGNLDLPFVEELAADIFMGRFSTKFVRATHYAGDLLHGSLYAAYYDIDYSAVPGNRKSSPIPRSAAGTDEFAVLCKRRAGVSGVDSWSVASNGTIIEQAQILTTHNLAILTGPFGIGDAMQLDWGDLADRCLLTVFALVGRLRSNPKPLRTIKDAAYAWRQMVFFLARLAESRQRAFTVNAQHALDGQPEDVIRRLSPALLGLAHVVDGGRFDKDGHADDGRRLVGWTTVRHWMTGDAASGSSYSG